MTQANELKTGHTIVALFEEVGQAEQAINDLKVAGFTPDAISVITKDRGEQKHLTETSGNEAGQGTLVGSLGGGTLGAVLGWLLAGGTALIPGVGPIVAAGIFGATVSGALIGGTIGGISGALAGSGIPEDEANEYEEHVKGGRTLVSVNAANGNLLESAMNVFERNGATNTRYYDLAQPGGRGQTYTRATTTTTTAATDTNTVAGGSVTSNSKATVTQPGNDPTEYNRSIYADGKSDIADPEEFASPGISMGDERLSSDDISTLPDRGTGTSTRGGYMDNAIETDRTNPTPRSI